jgi:hypothetical protein
MRKLQTALHTKDANLPSYNIAADSLNTRKVFASFYVILRRTTATRSHYECGSMQIWK